MEFKAYIPWYVENKINSKNIVRDKFRPRNFRIHNLWPREGNWKRKIPIYRIKDLFLEFIWQSSVKNLRKGKMVILLPWACKLNGTEMMEGEKLIVGLELQFYEVEKGYKCGKWVLYNYIYTCDIYLWLGKSSASII